MASPARSLRGGHVLPLSLAVNTGGEEADALTQRVRAAHDSLTQFH